MEIKINLHTFGFQVGPNRYFTAEIQKGDGVYVTRGNTVHLFESLDEVNAYAVENNYKLVEHLDALDFFYLPFDTELDTLLNEEPKRALATYMILEDVAYQTQDWEFLEIIEDPIYTEMRTEIFIGKNTNAIQYREALAKIFNLTIANLLQI